MAVAHCPRATASTSPTSAATSPAHAVAVVARPPSGGQSRHAGGTTSIAAERLVSRIRTTPTTRRIDPGRSESEHHLRHHQSGGAGCRARSTSFRLHSEAARSPRQKVIDLTVPKSTDQEAVSASAHPCAPAFLLRTYNTLYEFRAASGATLEAAFSAMPVVVPVATETRERRHLSSRWFAAISRRAKVRNRRSIGSAAPEVLGPPRA